MNGRNVVVYGAGNHTRWLERVVCGVKKGPAIIEVLDDCADKNDTFWGHQVVCSSSWAGAEVDGVILSSDIYQAQMKERWCELYGEGYECVDLYRGFGPGPYPKRDL